MTSFHDTLQQALGTAYSIERELGGGGMSRVFLAKEMALGRRVVIKVLPPELTATVSADRFHREIQVAANLQHPHIVPLLTAGRAGDLLYYTMPLVEGETLRGRLAREGELPVEQACQILAEVARALSYAHRHGIVHRDIKPENILLSEGEAQVADFGIAKAIAVSSQGEGLTTRGLALGTPAYMAPEQAAAESAIDARADLYALGVVAYEMLTGSPPFSERTPQALMAAHAVRHPEPLTARRPSVPARLGALVMRLLEKHPADRPQTADDVLHQLQAANETHPATIRVEALTAGARRGRWLVTGGVAALALLAALAWLRSRGPTAKLDRRVVAVVPFRVAGADSSLRYLREGMLDLLAAKLSGTKELRTVDPRTLLHTWQRSGGSVDSDLDDEKAQAVARQVGAGRVLQGEVVGTLRRMALTARLSDVSGAAEMRASVEGPSDSLTSLVDRLAAELLALGAGEEQHRLAFLTTTLLPALRAYLDGRSAHRRGHFAEAVANFDGAIELDSSFALAGIGRSMAAIWLGEGTGGPGSVVAWRHRDRLSGRDQALLRFLVGRRYPAITSARENLADAQAVVEASPDNPEAWAVLGDWTYHFGPLVGMSDARERSVRAYERALALDSMYAPSLEHLHEIYYAKGDIAAARQAIALRLRLDSVTPLAAAHRWFARQFLADTVLGAISLRDDSLLARPFEISRAALVFGAGLAAAESVLAVSRARVSTDREQERLRARSRDFYLVLGRPRRAQAVMGDPLSPFARAAGILDALYADADFRLAAKLAARVPRSFGRIRQADQGRIWEQYAAAQYDLSLGRHGRAREAVLAWKSAGTSSETLSMLVQPVHLAVLLDAQLAVYDRPSGALARLIELDSLLQDAPSWGAFENVGNLVSARLWHARGDVGRALAGIRRRVIGLEVPSTFATSLREEARYAALAGDREGAIRAYRHYLTLRSDPEPAVRPKVEEVRAELAALERESTDR
jgi:eukaryotic-like serine/threonine-protein kinase